MADIRDGLYEIVEEQRPMTNRQVFYRAVSRGLIEKKEGEYKGTVNRLLTEMRFDGTIPFTWMADNTRWMRKPTTFDSMEAALQHTADSYRRDLWADADEYVEIWLEKDALAGVLIEVTSEYDVPLMVSRGYSSLSYLYSAAEAIEHHYKPAHIYYFGDYDPSGVDIPRNIQARLREFAPYADIHFEIVAVTPEQIGRHELPTRPTKKSDSRAKRFGLRSVELDAIEPSTCGNLAGTALNNISTNVNSNSSWLQSRARERSS